MQSAVTTIEGVCIAILKPKKLIEVNSIEILWMPRILCKDWLSNSGKTVDEPTVGKECALVHHKRKEFNKSSTTSRHILFVKGLTRTFVIDTLSSSTIQSLNAIVAEKEGISKVDFRLCLSNRPLDDSQKTISECCIKNESTVLFHLYVIGGGKTIKITFNNETIRIKDENFSYTEFCSIVTEELKIKNDSSFNLSYISPEGEKCTITGTRSYQLAIDEMNENEKRFIVEVIPVLKPEGVFSFHGADLTHELEASFRRYCEVGAVLKDCEEIRSLQQSISRWDGDCSFMFAAFSSGYGKKQIPFCLFPRPVIYIPFPSVGKHSQHIYECFHYLSDELRTALDDGLSFIEKYHSKGLNGIPEDVPFRTLGYVTELIKLSYEREGVLVLTSINTVKYDKLTVDDAQERIRNYFSFKRGDCDASRNPVIFLDKIPQKDINGATNLFAQCIFLRNLIRCVEVLCILAGTESAAISMIGTSTTQATRVDKHAFVKLITKLPPVNTQLFLNLNGVKISEREMLLLSKTRPLFVDWLTKSIKIVQSPLLDMKTLKAAGNYFRKYKQTASTIRGIFSQLTMVFTNGFNHHDIQTLSLISLRNHFADTVIDSKFINTESRLLELDAGNNDLFYNVSELETFKFVCKFKDISDDPLLYLVCFSSGIFGNSELLGTWINYIGKLSADPLYNYAPVLTFPPSLALFLCRISNVHGDIPFLPYLETKKNDDDLLEQEMYLNCLIASYYNPSQNLSGTTLSTFLAYFISGFDISLHKTTNLKASEALYPRYSIVEGFSTAISELKIGLLSPPKVYWDVHNENIQCLLQSSVCLSNSEWIKNAEQIDGLIEIVNSSSEGSEIDERIASMKVSSSHISLESKIYISCWTSQKFPFGSLCDIADKGINKQVRVAILVCMDITEPQNSTLSDVRKHCEEKKIEIHMINPASSSALKAPTLVSSISPDLTLIVIPLERIYKGRINLCGRFYMK